jgi:nucleotide-binding universal stress UspA family protein
MIPQRILVATDGSPAAQAAETLAADLAWLMVPRGPVEVVAMTAIHDVGHLGPETAGYIPLSEEVTEGREVSESAAARIRALLPDTSTGSIKVEAKVVEALTPGGAIIAEAHAAGTCSLIVMGNRGHGAVAEAFLGSVSQDVIHRAHCPVLIARA